MTKKKHNTVRLEVRRSDQLSQTVIGYENDDPDNITWWWMVSKNPNAPDEWIGPYNTRVEAINSARLVVSGFSFFWANTDLMP